MTTAMMTLLKGWVQVSVKNSIKMSPFFVRHRSKITNVYHCSVYRTGSQWLRSILSDMRVCRYSGLLHEMHFQRIFGTAQFPDRTVNYEDFPFKKPFARRRIVSIYASYENYTLIPKPEHFRTFFIFRDPRDIVVSHYFASLRDARHFNSPDYRILADPDGGISFMIDKLKEMGLFSSLRSWASIPKGKPHVLLLQFEELCGTRKFESFKELFGHCDIAMPENVLKTLLKEHSFEALSGGRKPGQEDENSHYRKGVIGDWKNHFMDKHIDKFKAVTGDLVTFTNYTW